MELRSRPPSEASRIAAVPETPTLEQALIPEEDFRLLFENSLTITLVLRPDFTIVAANKERLRTTFTTLQDVIGRNLFDAFPDNPNQQNPTGVRNLRASLERVLRTRMADTIPVQRYDIRRSRSEGDTFEERWWSVINSPVCDDTGQVKYLVHRVADVTADVLLRRETDEKNKIAADLRQQTEQMGQQISLTERDLQYTRQQLIENNQELWRNKAQLSEANAKLDAYARELEDRVCERTQRLETALKASRDLLYTIAHDLRAPLRAMRGFTEALEDEYAGQLDELGADYIRRIHEASGRMDQLIAEVLEFGRIAHVPISRTPVNLEEEVKDVLDGLAIVIHKTGATIKVDSPLPSVCGEKQLVQKMIRNLVDNALKFVAPNKSPNLHIYATTGERRVRLWIADTGIGISPEHHERIFGMFQRLHRGKEYPGSGFGLAIVQRAVEHMGGSVGVQSQPGNGSQFWIELPDETHCNEKSDQPL